MATPDKHLLTGCIPALVTPFLADGPGVNVEAVPPLVELLLGAGVSGLYLCGSTGNRAGEARGEHRRFRCQLHRAARQAQRSRRRGGLLHGARGRHGVALLHLLACGDGGGRHDGAALPRGRQGRPEPRGHQVHRLQLLPLPAAAGARRGRARPPLQLLDRAGRDGGGRAGHGVPRRHRLHLQRAAQA
mmetsp:Transcript_56853/g.176341  ORF Transcript_56853/g.176341 Transcript_56853/m.176341 type:complete len:188 (-) Transcript_56853:408-971(-)